MSQISMEESNDKDQVSFNDKVKLSERLKTLSPLDLGAVVEEIMQKCPLAFKQTGE